jgi:hypothetical protein
MTTSAYFSNEEALLRIHEGPLVIHADQYELARQWMDTVDRADRTVSVSLATSAAGFCERRVVFTMSMSRPSCINDRARDRRPPGRRTGQH